MAGRRLFVVIVLLAAVLHAISIARSFLPAQDGLKFIHVARQFQKDAWPDVVRDTDQHPLYPALVAAVEPIVAACRGAGPDTWRISAQVVATLASLALLFPLFGLARSLFDTRIACVALAIYVLLPVPAEVGHDTLSDSLGLLAILLSLRLGALAMRRESWRYALAAGLSGGIGYLARPEAILAPAAVGLAWAFSLARTVKLRNLIWAPAPAVMVLAALLMVGGYALVKGEVSEKLALRHGAAIGPQQIMIRSVPQLLPRGLAAKKLDFSPKEESERTPVRSPIKALRWMASDWWDELCWGFAALALWGLVRQRFVLGLCRDRDPDDAGRTERLVLGVFAAVFVLVLLRHTVSLGYLSGRHVIPLVAISVPWAAAGTFVCLRGLGVKLPWSPGVAWATAVVATSVVVGTLVIYQLRPSHRARSAHWEAGQWLAEHARPADMVLDTRGWARFVSGAPGYDYWHVRQALTDSHLSYVVVGHEELAANTTRARALNTLLAYAATPIVDFPSFAGKRDVGVRVYRFHQPDSWEG
ncbi:MAG: ArnT family glycosyltransferase, partial [Isosphaeraceae bacterium]